MRKFFINNCTLYRLLICKLFGAKNVTKLSFPCGILSDWNVFYVTYDENGNVKRGFSNLFDALKNKKNLYLSVLYD